MFKQNRKKNNRENGSAECGLKEYPFAQKATV